MARIMAGFISMMLTMMVGDCRCHPPALRMRESIVCCLSQPCSPATSGKNVALRRHLRRPHDDDARCGGLLVVGESRRPNPPCPPPENNKAFVICHVREGTAAGYELLSACDAQPSADSCRPT
jgi:hypothetical protein